MAETRSVVITGASRGLGLASASHLYKQGWRVVAAMRSVDAGMEKLREATGAGADDPRLIGVPLDLTDSASVTAAAKSIEEAVGAPYGVGAQRGYLRGRNGRRSADEPVGANVRNQHLRPGGADQGAAAVDAGGGPGPHRAHLQRRRGARNARNRTVFRGEGCARAVGRSRWPARSAPFGIGVTILVTGTYDTDIITDTGTTDSRDFDGPYAAPPQPPWTSAAALAMKYGAKSPDRFAAGLAKALDGTRRRSCGGRSGPMRECC